MLTTLCCYIMYNTIFLTIIIIKLPAKTYIFVFWKEVILHSIKFKYKLLNKFNTFSQITKQSILKVIMIYNIK